MTIIKSLIIFFLAGLCEIGGGYLDKKYIWYIPVLMVLAYAGSWLGKKLLDKVPEEIFKKLVLVLIFGIGAFMVYGFIAGKQIIK